MKKIFSLLVAIFLLCSAFMTVQEHTDSFKFRVDTAKINGSQWSIPYRFENKELKSLSVKLIIENNKNEVLDPNLFSLIDDDNNLRIRPSGIFYLRSNEKKKYLKSRSLNKNYNVFENDTIVGYKNFQAKTFKPNIFGKKRKGQTSSVKSLKKIRIKNRATYYIDFPVKKEFTDGKLYYRGRSIGFAAVKQK